MTPASHGVARTGRNPAGPGIIFPPSSSDAAIGAALRARHSPISFAANPYRHDPRPIKPASHLTAPAKALAVGNDLG
jgi:hypothetical protein